MSATPGPWHMAGPVGAGIWIQSDASPNIAAVHGAATDTGRANARLIAASPDLLEALRGVEDYLRANVPADGWGLRDKGADADRQALIEKVCAAIAKAEGK